MNTREQHSDVQAQLSDLVHKVIGVSIEPDDDFFAAGGDSLSAVQLSALARAAGLELSSRQVFALRTVSGWSRSLEARTAAAEPTRASEQQPGAAPAVGEPSAAQGESDELSILQEARLHRWAYEKLHGIIATHDRYSATYRIRGPLRADVLSQAVDEVVRRHRILRTRFRVDGDLLTHWVSEFSGNTLATAPRMAPTDDWLAVAAQYLEEPFDSLEHPLLRTTLIPLGPQDMVLVICAHHVILDGEWSLDLLLRDIAAVYNQLTADKGADLPSPPPQFDELARRQREVTSGPRLETSLGFWKQRLQGTGPIPRFSPAGAPPVPEEMTARAGQWAGTVSRGTKEAIKSLQRVYGATPFVAMLAALLAVQHCHTGEENVGVVFPVANREWPESAQAIGPFSHLLPFPGTVSPDTTLADLLRRTAHDFVEVQAHADLPLDELLRHLRPESYLAPWPHRAIVFTLHQDRPLGTPIPELRIEHVGVPTTRMENFSLWLTQSSDADGEWRIGAEFDADWLPHKVVESFVSDLDETVRLMAASPAMPLRDLTEKLRK